MAKITITLRDRQFEALPLSRKLLKEHAQQMGALEKGALPGADALSVMFEVVLAAIRQCNPALTEAEFDEVADTSEIQAAYYTVMTGSIPPKSGEVTASR